jgi:hypothetical protein
MSHPVGERLGLAGAGAGGDQQCRRFGIAVDAVFDSATLFRIEAVQMPPAIDRLQLRVPFPFAATAIASARQGRNACGSVRENAPCAVVRRSASRVGFARPPGESSLRVEASCFAPRRDFRPAERLEFATGG